MATLQPFPKFRAFDADGNPLTGGKVYTYAAGTSTPLVTYTDSSGSPASQNQNPVTLDANGEADIWYGDNLYKLSLFSSTGVLQWTIDNIGSGGSASTTTGGFGEATDIASASLVDLGSITTHFANITGTTTITSFGTSAVITAPIYLIKFEGALTLTNSANLFLPGSANVTTAQNDRALVEYLGSGAWRVFSYMRADGTPLYVTTIAGAISLTGDISPAQLVANTNDWAPTGFASASVIRFSTDASRNLTGIAAGTDGRTVIMTNIGSFPLVLVHDATSTAANRFYCPNSVNYTMNPFSSVLLQYDATLSRWFVKSQTGLATATDIATGTDPSLAPSVNLMGLNLIATTTASSSASLSFTSGITSTYSSYVFELTDIKAATNDVSFRITFSTDGGSSYLNSAYQYQVSAAISGTGASSEGSASAAIILLTKSAGGSAGLGNSASYSYSGVVTFYAPSGAVNAKKLNVRGAYYNAAGTLVDVPVVGSNNTTSAVNAIKFDMSSGNIASGTIKMYGKK